MLKSHSLYFLIIVCCLHHTTTRAATTNPRATSFIKASCQATQYPLLCFHSLSIYAAKIQESEHQLAQAALAVSLANARSATVFVTKLSRVSGIKAREHQAVKDCIANMADSVDQLSRSVKELGQMGQTLNNEDFMWHASNVQTWVSAALTDENTCLDGFGHRVVDGKVKTDVRRRIVNAGQVTSVALALVSRFTERHT